METSTTYHAETFPGHFRTLCQRLAGPNGVSYTYLDIGPLTVFASLEQLAEIRNEVSRFLEEQEAASDERAGVFFAAQYHH